MNDELLQRAGQLRAQGVKPVSVLRKLKREFPHLERLDLHIAAGLGPTGRYLLSAEISNPLSQVTTRRDARPKHPPRYMTEAETNAAIAIALAG